VFGFLGERDILGVIEGMDSSENFYEIQPPAKIAAVASSLALTKPASAHQ